jgi:DNA-binding NarL/FixJ family response regulator
MISSVGAVLVASADRLFAETAARFIERHTRLATITEADGVRALMAVARLEPSAVLVLGELSRLPTHAFARRLRARWPSLTLVMLGSADPNEPGWLPENADGDAVLAAIAASPTEIRSSLDVLKPDDVALLQTLTKQERRVLVLLSQGLDFREIAGRLSISEHTVRTHLQNLYRKLNVHSRLEIIRLAAQHGFLDPAGDETE